jgi:hypothetical protein
MYTGTEPLGTTKFSDWLKSESDTLGRRYRNDLNRRCAEPTRQPADPSAHLTSPATVSVPASLREPSTYVPIADTRRNVCYGA